MKIAVVSATTTPACLPDDPLHTSFYGSEMYNAVLVKGLADAGHEIGFYAPAGSTSFTGHPSIKFHPLINSNGAHLNSELFEDCAFDGSKTEDLTAFDFVIDMSKQAHVSEELRLYHDYKRYANYRSGYQDWTFPMRCEPHFVTHCSYFADHFKANGHDCKVARFGLPAFWNRDEDPAYGNPDIIGYFLFPHRPNADKGIDTVVRLAKQFKSDTFVISTSTPFEDHKREMARIKAECVNIPNVTFIDIPQNKHYHWYRRGLLRNASAVLSLFRDRDGYMDTGGLTSFEAIRCGTPVIVSDSPGSREMLGSLEGKGVSFVDGYSGAALTIKHNDFQSPTVRQEWMPIKTYVDDWLKIIDARAP